MSSKGAATKTAEGSSLIASSSLLGCLPSEFAEHLKEKVSEDHYETTSQWIVVLNKEVDGVLLPMFHRR
jgi:hypothetical protein